MAFDASKLVLMATGNGHNIWFYDSGADAMNTVDTADYFLSAISQLNIGDVIFVLGASAASFGMCYVKDKSASSVDVADIVTQNTDSR